MGLDPARRAKAAKAGLTVVESPAEVFRNSRVIIFSLPADMASTWRLVNSQ